MARVNQLAVWIGEEKVAGLRRTGPMPSPANTRARRSPITRSASRCCRARCRCAAAARRRGRSSVIEGVVYRVHQEDACQALGIDPAVREGGRGKYESHGGPTLNQVARLLNAYGADPDA